MLKRAVLLFRWLAWSLVLPLAGSVLLGVTNPIVGFVIVLFAAARPVELLGFIYMTGLVPSALTVAVYLCAATRYRVLFRVAMACSVAAISAAVWWTVLDHFISTDTRIRGWQLVYMAVIATAATTLLAFDHRIGIKRARGHCQTYGAGTQETLRR